MKKLLFAAIFACAALFTSCTTNEGTGTENLTGSYTGTLNVYGVDDGVLNYSQESAVFSFESVDGVGELVMNSIKFSSSIYAPYLTIVASDIPMDSNGDYTIASVVPTIGGDTYEMYTLTDVVIKVSDSAIDVKFDCSTSSVEFAGE